MNDDEKAKKIGQVKELLLMNRADTLRADRYTQYTKVKTLAQLRVEREQLEHQLLLLNDFQETVVAKILSDLQMVPSTQVAVAVASDKPKGDDDDGKELVPTT